METNVILPVLNTEDLQKKANEYAQKGAEDAIKEFYTGYNSPYKKAIEDSLKGKAIGSSIDIPDIIGILNTSISQEIDLIANNAISKTFIPLVQRFLTREDTEIKLSDMMEEFIRSCDFDHNENDMDDYIIEIKKDDGSFLYLEMSDGKKTYEIHFMLKSNRGETPKVYEMYTLPYFRAESSTSKFSYRTHSTEKVMKISLDGGATLELPFTTGVLEDEFTSYVARLIICKSKITFDKTEFDSDMFPERERCHCD